MASDVRVWDGTKWESLRGPKGDPTTISAAGTQGVTATVAGPAATPTINVGLGDIAPTSVRLGSSGANHNFTFDTDGKLIVSSNSTQGGRTILWSDPVTNRLWLGSNAATITIGNNNYPTTSGTNGQVLTTNGSGTLSWQTPTGGGLTQTDADARYVNITGDTMTGPLLVSQAGDAAVGVTSTGGNIAALQLTNQASGGRAYRIAAWGALGAGALAIDDTTANARRLTLDSAGNFTVAETLYASKGVLASGGRSLFRAVNESFAVGAAFSATGGCVYFGASNATTTPDAVISAAGGNALMTLQNGGNVGIGTASPQHRLDVEGIASVHGLSIDSNDTNGGHISAEPAGLSVWRGKWGTGDLMGWWRSDTLEQYSDNSVAWVGSQCADTTNAGSFAGVRAYHVSSGSVQLIAYPGGNHYAYSDGTGGTFNIGTASTKDLYLYTNNASRLLVSKDGPATAYSSWTFTQNATFQGTTNTFPARSINNNAVAFATPKQINVAAYTVVAADAGTILWNVHTAADAFINLPTDAEAAIPVGATIRIMADTTRLTYIRPNAGASLFWQASSSGSFPDNSTRQGGSGPTFATRPLGRLSLTQVVKVAANTWYHFPN